MERNYTWRSLHMKKSLFLFILVFAFCSLFFNSCKNFLNGSGLKEELDEIIEFTTAKDPLILESIIPQYSVSGISCNASIEIRFNQSINEDTFVYEIKRGDNSIEDYYSAPIFNLSKKVVTLVPDAEKIKNLFFDSEHIDVNLYLDGHISSVEGNKLSLSTVSHSFRLNNFIDTDKPVITDFKVAKSKEDLLNNTNLMSLKNSEQWKNEEINNQRTNSLWIYVKGYDYTNGLKNVFVTETVNEFNRISNINVCLNEELSDVKFWACDESSYYETIFEYKFGDNTDGLAEVSFSFSDGINLTESSNTVCVIKDTKASSDSYFIFNTPLDNAPITAVEPLQEMYKIQKNCDTFYIKLKNEIAFSRSSDGLVFEASEPVKIASVKYSVEGTDIRDVCNKQTYTGNENYDFSFEIPDFKQLNKEKDVILYISLIDDLGNETLFTNVVPKQIYIFTHEFKEKGTLGGNAKNLNSFLISAIDNSEFSIYNDGHVGFKYPDETKYVRLYYYFKTVTDNKLYLEKTPHTTFIADEKIETDSELGIFVSQIFETENQCIISIPETEYVIDSSEKTKPRIPSYTYVVKPGKINSYENLVTFYITEDISDQKNNTYYMLPRFFEDDKPSLTDQGNRLFILEEKPKQIELEPENIITSYGEVTCVIPSMDECCFNMCVYNGSSYTLSSEIFYSRYGDECTGIKVLGVYDTTPPDVDSGGASYFYDRLFAHIDGLGDMWGAINHDIVPSGLYSEDNKTYGLKLWQTDSFYVNTPAEQLSEISIKCENISAALSETGKSLEAIDIPFNIPGSGHYYLYSQLKDMAGNYNEYPENFLDFAYYALKPVSYALNNKELTITGDLEDSVDITFLLDYGVGWMTKTFNEFDDIKYSVKYNVFNTDSSEWNGEKTLSETKYTKNINAETNKYSIKINDITVLNGNNFVMLYPMAEYSKNNITSVSGRSSNSDLYGTPLCFYTGDYTLSSKRHIDISESAVWVSSDAPIMVITYSNTVNFEKDTSKWLNFSAPVNSRFIEGSDYYEIDTDSIDDGDYYCVIAHYADGSVWQSKIYQK